MYVFLEVCVESCI